MEIGNNFHEHPDDIDHISVLNMGPTFYMVEVADILLSVLSLD